jgi:hypothetical protein
VRGQLLLETGRRGAHVLALDVAEQVAIVAGAVRARGAAARLRHQLRVGRRERRVDEPAHVLALEMLGRALRGDRLPAEQLLRRLRLQPRIRDARDQQRDLRSEPSVPHGLARDLGKAEEHEPECTCDLDLPTLPATSAIPSRLSFMSRSQPSASSIAFRSRRCRFSTSATARASSSVRSRTTTGSITPRSRMESANSAMACASK